MTVAAACGFLLGEIGALAATRALHVLIDGSVVAVMAHGLVLRGALVADTRTFIFPAQMQQVCPCVSHRLLGPMTPECHAETFP